MTSNPAIIIIDPNELFREGLRRILGEAGFKSVWCSGNPPVDPINDMSSDAVPLPIVGTDIAGAATLIADIKRLWPDARPVLLLEEISHNQIAAAFRSGAETVVLRNTSCETLIGTLRLVLDGATVLPAELLKSLLRACDVPASPVCVQSPGIAHDTAEPVFLPLSSGLSPREQSVLQHLRIGLPNKEIARSLGITEATVKVHVKAILRKARVRNRTQIALWATKFEPVLAAELFQLPRLMVDAIAG